MRFVPFFRKGVFYWKDAFFYVRALGWGMFTVAVLCGHIGYAACPAPTFDKHAVVQSVIDGDTVRLADKNSVRLIGINSPEIGYDGALSQPLALAARKFLATLLHERKSIALVYGVESRDRHGRLLAHMFVNDGGKFRNAQQLLLENGLAFWVAVAPNTRWLDCYRAAEEKAKKQQLGIWREAYFRPKNAANSNALTPGFQLLQGRITSVFETKNSFWLKFNNIVALRITRKDIHNFEPDVLKALKGKTVTARGWLYKHKNHLTMQISHPRAIESRP